MPVSLKELIARRAVNTRVMALLQQHAVEAIAEARSHGNVGHIDECSIEFTDDFRTISIHPAPGTQATEQEVVAEFGQLLLHAMEASPHQPKRLVKIAHACINGKVRHLAELDLRLERRLADTIYIPLIVLIVALLSILYTFCH